MVLAGLLIGSITLGAAAQIAGHVELDLSARRIPTTVSDEIKLDTPSEYTMFELAVNSRLDLTLETGFIDPRVKAAVNTAGLEHFVLSAPIDFGDLLLFGSYLDDMSLVPEIWIAVPFEHETDVNNLPNSVMVPPGEALLASARVTTDLSVGGFDIEHLFMLEDVSFPSPSGAYDPLFYEREDQHFSVGSLTTASWRASGGFTMQASLGLSASNARKSIKGHTDQGKVTPGDSFARVGANGIRLGSVSLLGVGIQDIMLGTSFSISTGEEAKVATTIAISGEAWEGTSLGTSISFASFPPTVSSLTLTATHGPFRFSIALDSLEIRGLSAQCGSTLSLGPISGSWALSVTGIERGITGIAANLTLAEGVFSTNTSITFSQRGDKFGFASWANKFSFRFSPAVVSAQVTFGRHGLTRAVIAVSVTF